jgi:hypothetical protein
LSQSKELQSSECTFILPRNFPPKRSLSRCFRREGKRHAAQSGDEAIARG